MQKTIIIQGAINNYDQLQHIIDNLRTWFTGELIISTWEGQNNNLTGYDKIIFCEDPGAGPFNGLYPVEQHCNLKRQLYGFKKALEICSNDLIFKVRNDCLITKDIFQFYNFKRCCGNLKLFDNKVVVSNMMTTNPDITWEPRTWFRISDWFYLGLKEDLEKICNVYENLDETDFSHTFFGTEHILSFNLLKKYVFKDLTIDKYVDYTPLSWDYIINNFVIIDTKSTAGIINIGKWKNQPEYLDCYITQQVYEKKCLEIVNERRIW